MFVDMLKTRKFINRKIRVQKEKQKKKQTFAFHIMSQYLGTLNIISDLQKYISISKISHNKHVYTLLTLIFVNI